jgi:hypothetical protein
MNRPTTHNLGQIEAGIVCVEPDCELRGEIIRANDVTPFTLRELKQAIIDHETRERRGE